MEAVELVQYRFQKEFDKLNKAISDSQATPDLATALAKAQMSIKHPTKKNSVSAGSYSYDYADLATVIDCIKTAFAPNGLSFTQLPTVSIRDMSVTIKTLLLHSSGQKIESALVMGLNDIKPQTIGSAITYARRYALSCMAGIASEADDYGQKASGKK